MLHCGQRERRSMGIGAARNRRKALNGVVERPESTWHSARDTRQGANDLRRRGSEVMRSMSFEGQHKPSPLGRATA